MYLSVFNSNTKIVYVDQLIEEVDRQVDGDNKKFCLENKSKLIRSFIILRLCNEILAVIESNKNSKLIFVITKTARLIAINDHFNFVYTAFLRLSKLLSLNYIIDNTSISKLKLYINSESGEGREVRYRIMNAINKYKILPNLKRFKLFLRKYNIVSIDSIDKINLKLGLFLT